MSEQDFKFDPKELAHYNRHLSIPEFGMEAQKKLKHTSVAVIGCGGLGSPVLQYLAAAGIGTIGIIDFDVVEASNLHRQVLFGVSDVGKKKVDIAKKRLQDLNPHITINTHDCRLTSENALEVLEPYDIIADGTDNFQTRYLVNDAAILLDKPNVYASIFQFEGQVSVFNYTNKEGNTGPNYRDLFPTPPPPGLVPNCAEAGVLGVLPGIIGSLQASEVIKLAANIGEPLSGRMFLFDALDFSTRTITIEKNPDREEVTELIDYEQFCGIEPAGDQEESTSEASEKEVREISVTELNEILQNGNDVQVIDVREPHEYEIANIDGELIPLGDVEDEADKISREKKVVVHCRSGGRSSEAVKKLQDKYGFDNLYNLKGGILAWAEEIDPSMPKY